MHIEIDIEDKHLATLQRVFGNKSEPEIVQLAVLGLLASTAWFHNEAAPSDTPYLDLTPGDVALQQLRDAITYPEDDEALHMLRKAIDAAQGGYDAWRVQSTGERLAVALVLNQSRWLAEMDYTIAEALERIGPRWSAAICSVARAVKSQIGT